MTANGKPAPWTDEQDAMLRKLVGDGLSSGQIVKAMATLRPGLTRCGVIGRCLRTGLQLAGNNGQPVKRRQAARPKPNPRIESGAPAIPLPPPLPPPPAATWAPLAGTHPRPLLECGAMACRWPVTGAGGAMLFCCASRGNGPYCPTHCRIAYVPRRVAA